MTPTRMIPSVVKKGSEPEASEDYSIELRQTQYSILQTISAIGGIGARRNRVLSYNRRYHHAFAGGYWIVFVCFVIIAIATMTDIVPLALQPRFITLLVAAMVVGGVIAMTGFLKSYDRNAYPLMITIWLIVAILCVILYLTTR